jgi:hypothetical protein
MYGVTPRDSLNNSINGLHALKQMVPLDLGSVNWHPVPRNSHDGIIIENVFINVRPDALITQTSKGMTRMGAVKLHFPKTNSLGQKGGECVASILYEYLSQLSSPLGVPKSKLCHSVDVHPNAMYQSPTSYKRIMKDVEAGCRQYKLIWDSI